MSKYRVRLTFFSLTPLCSGMVDKMHYVRNLVVIVLIYSFSCSFSLFIMPGPDFFDSLKFIFYYSYYYCVYITIENNTDLTKPHLIKILVNIYGWLSNTGNTFMSIQNPIIFYVINRMRQA